MSVSAKKLLEIAQDSRATDDWCNFCIGVAQLVDRFAELTGVDGKPFRSAKDLITCTPPFGLGVTVNVVIHAFLAIREEVPANVKAALSIERAEAASPTSSGGRPPILSKGTTVVPLSKGGQDRQLAQMAKNHPDILAKLKAGEFPSVRQASIAAGIVKIKTPLQQLEHWWSKADATQRCVFRNWIDEDGD